MQTSLREIVEEAASKLASVSEDRASRKPALNKWSAKEILGHLIDSSVVNLERILRVSLENHLSLHAYPQDQWVRLQAYQTRPFSEIRTLWQALNLHIAHVVEQLPNESLEHTFSVPQAKDVTLRFLIEDYLAHLEHHLKQVWSRVAAIEIRPAQPEDAEAIAGLVRQAWAGKVAANSSGHQETPEKVRLDLQKGFAWVALEGEKVVGSVRLVRHPHEIGVWEIKKLGVLGEYRGQGLAHQLMEALFHKAFDVGAKELRLAVRHDQQRLVEWYGQFGFQLEPHLGYSAANPNTPAPFVLAKKLEVQS